MQTANIAVILPFGWLPLRSSAAAAPLLLRSEKICTFAAASGVGLNPDQVASGPELSPVPLASKCQYVFVFLKVFYHGKRFTILGQCIG